VDEKAQGKLLRTLAILEEETPGLTAGLILVTIESNREPLFLLLESGDTRYVFPGGRMNTGETLLETALRETREEVLGTGEIEFPWGTGFKRTRKYGKRKSRQGVYFVARTGLLDLKVGFNVSKGRSEHKGYHWLPYQQARSLVKKRLQPVLDWAYESISRGHPLAVSGQPAK